MSIKLKSVITLFIAITMLSLILDNPIYARANGQSGKKARAESTSTTTSVQTVTSAQTTTTSADVAVPQTIQSGETSYKLVWNDEFSGSTGTAPDSNKWGYPRLGTSKTGWGNQSLNAYTDSRKNSFLDGNGNLVIRTLKENYQGAPYTSAYLATQNKVDWKYGRFEIRAKLPVGGKGIWPAIWMMPANDVYGDWPNSGEIDIMEMIGSDPTQIVGTIHYGDVAGQHEQLNAKYRIPDTGYHTYAVEWDEASIRWYIDDVLYQTRSKAEWSNSNAGNGPFDQEFYLILNIAVGGTWPGSPDDSVTFGQDMNVDYVRVYEKL